MRNRQGNQRSLLLRKLTAATTAVALLCASLPTQADLGGALDSMFVTATTRPGVYQSQSRMGLVGGSFTMGGANKTVNIINFTPPRIEAGCGGIDLFLGSFSMISGEQFKQLLKQIGSAAAGYFFELALKTMCQQCADVLTSLRNYANLINQSNINSCRIARGAVNDLWDGAGMAQRKDDKGQTIGTTDSLFSDFTSAMSSFSSLFDRRQAETTTGASNPDAYNLVWRMLAKGRATEGTNGFATSDGAMAQVLMSMTGTVINGNTPQNCTGAGTSASAQNCKGPSMVRVARLDFDDFFEGSAGRNKKQWVCSDSSNLSDPTACQDVIEGNFNWIGARGWVHQRLFGSTDETDFGERPGSLVYAVINNQPLTPNGDLAKFVSMSTLPLYSAMRQLKDKEAVRTYAVFVREYYARDVATRLMQSLLEAVSRAKSDSEVSAPPDWANTLDKIRGQIAARRPNPQEHLVMNKYIRDYISVVNASATAGLLYAGDTAGMNYR